VSAINHVLAVIGLHLKGELSGTNVNLEWTTLSEVNTAYFSIERSNDGVHYFKIGEMPASGNTSSIRHYSFVDPNATAENNYYRIRLVDQDSKYNLSNTILIKLSGTSTGIVLLSNPAFSQIQILFKNKAADYAINVYTGLGDKIRTEATKITGGNQTHLIDINGWTPGVYFIKLMNRETREVTTLPVVVLK
jgi:hypothetical protein